MTPSAVAKFMASRSLEGVHKKVIRILEPAAGSGILAAAIFEHIITWPKLPQKLEFVLYEIDPLMKPALSALASRMRKEAAKLGFSVSCSIRLRDFLLNSPEEKFDIVIANPPFFKVRKDDPRSIAHKYVVHGQPNIYGLFMASCAHLLSDGGRYCFLSPRSWTSGSYFRELRKHLFKYLQLEAVHLFQDRAATFKKDRIQQEMMITWATAQSAIQEDVMVSASDGITDLARSISTLVPISNIFTSKKCKAINLPLVESAHGIFACANTLETIGLKVSTGKVVPFRAGEWIVNRGTKKTAPLLWMQHIRRNEVVWPLNREGEHIASTEASAKLLIPNGNYVLVRRFSPRDQQHWVTAAPLLMDESCEYIGIENHVNYLYGVDAPLAREVAIGLASYLNSSQVSLYFVSRIGHTQINAADLNSLPVPNKEDLCKIGKEWEKKISQSEIDAFINTILAGQDRVNHESLKDEQRTT